MAKFFTSDLHLNDWRLGNYNPHFRPFETVEEQNRTIIDNINDVVKPEDQLYIIGDVALDEEGVSMLEEIACKNKTLITGNHDIPFLDALMPHFDLIVPSMELDLHGLDCYLNHYPSNGVEDRFNIVGHVHGLWKVQRNTINVSTDAWHFRPVPEEDILLIQYAMEHFYDDNVFMDGSRKKTAKK